MYAAALVIVFLILLFIYARKESFCEGGKGAECLCWQEQLDGSGPQAVSVGPVDVAVPIVIGSSQIPCPRRTDDQLLMAAYGLNAHANGISYY